jgi:hypothetical protein
MIVESQMISSSSTRTGTFPRGFSRRNSAFAALLAQVDERRLVLELFLSKDNPDLLAVRAVGIVVQFEHGSCLLQPAGTVCERGRPCNILEVVNADFL